MDKIKKKKILKTIFVISLIPKIFTFKALASHYISTHIDKEANYAYQLMNTSCPQEKCDNKYISGYIYTNDKLEPIFSDLES